MAVEIEDQTDVISVHTKKITGTTFTGQHKASSVVDFYDNYEASSIAGRVEPLPNGGKPVPDSLKKAQEYLIFGELKKGQQAGKSNLLANHALFFDIEPPNPKEGEAWEPLEYSDVNDVVSKELDGLQYVLHNTINSQEHYARFRLVIPTDQAMDEKEYHSAWDYVAEQLNALPLDSSSREWYRLQGAPIYNGLGTDVFEVNDVGELLSIEDINKHLEAMKADELSKNTTPQNVTTISADDFEQAMKLVVNYDKENLMKEEHYFKWFPILANGVKNGEIDENMAYLATSYISLGNADWERENRNRLRNELQKIGRGNLPPAEWTVRSKINAVPHMKKDPDNPVKSNKPVNKLGQLLDNKELKVFGYDDTGNAERLMLIHGDHIKYSYEARSWYFYNGKIWEQDRIGKIQQCAEDVPKYMRDFEPLLIPDGADKEVKEKIRKARQNFIKKTRDYRKKNDFIKESQHRVSVRLEQFDNVGNKINLQNGYYDLDKNKFYEHEKKKLFTLISEASYDPEAKCPKWIKFINETFCGDVELIDYVQRAVGYTLTNKTSERQMFFLWGSGSNGKSVFINVLEKLMGTYTENIDPKSLMVSESDGASASPAIAKLKGARFVSSSESKELGRLDESLVKRITGSDTVTARYLHQNEFSYVPQFKIWIATNHKPQVSGNDEAIWGRLVLIPFMNKVVGDRENKNLTNELLEEMTGIFNWVLEGYVKYMEQGLRNAEPDIIKEQRSSYKEEMDQVGAFISERCATGEEYEIKSSTLYEAYKQWCKELNIEPDSNQKFSPDVEAKGFEKKKKRDGLYFMGINISVQG